MADDSSAPVDLDREYVRFVIERAKRTDFRAEEKLQRIDELADIIFSAKKSLKGKSEE